MTRGCLSKEQYEKFNLTQKELRLIPYVQYLIINHSKVDLLKVDKEELEILNKWTNEDKIYFSINTRLTCTKEFWDFMNEVLWYSYAITD